VSTTTWPARSDTESAGSRDVARRPWWVWGAPFAALFGVLVARNTFLFSTRLYEQGDSGANSILIAQALRFRLLVGNYSRQGFNHPGPAYMYIQASGQWLAHDVLHLVPTPWNGQLLAIFALDSAFGALAVGIVYGWSRSVRGAAAAFIVVVGFAAAHPEVFNSGWMPFLYVVPFFVFLLAAASVAARQARDLWVLALSGWLLIHGHACFLFIVPVITAAAAVIALWPYRRHPLAAAHAFVRGHRAAWIPAVVISAVFILPIALNLILHWPGNFGKYFSYSNSSKAGGHTAGQIAQYALWYWSSHSAATGVLVLVVLLAAALAVPLLVARDSLRRYLRAVVAMAGVASVAFLAYVALGIDHLSAMYIGYFYWSVPFALLMVIAVGLATAGGRVPRAAALAVVAAAGVLIAFAVLGNLRTDGHDNNPQLPGAVAALAALSHGKPIVIEAQGAAWVETPGFLVQAERTGVRACVDQPGKAYLVTSQFICTAGDLSSGVRYQFLGANPPAGTRVILRFGTPMFGYAKVIAG
jgi:hypothetical protein